MITHMKLPRYLFRLLRLFYRLRHAWCAERLCRASGFEKMFGADWIRRGRADRAYRRRAEKLGRAWR